MEAQSRARPQQSQHLMPKTWLYKFYGIEQATKAQHASAKAEKKETPARRRSDQKARQRRHTWRKSARKRNYKSHAKARSQLA